MDEPLFKKTYQLAIKKISKKEYSSSELDFFLEEKGIEETVRSQIIQEFKNKNWINDDRFTEILIRRYGSQGKGERVILQKLKQKGLTASLSKILAILRENDGKTELERAIEIIEKRYPGYQKDPKIKNKAFQTLIRRGFSYEVANKAILNK